MRTIFLLIFLLYSEQALAQAPDYKNNPSFWINGNNATPVSNLTPISLITAIPTPTGSPLSQSYVVTDFTATNSNGSTSTKVQLLDGIIVKYECGTRISSRPCVKDLDTPILFSADSAIRARALTSGAAVRFSVQGYRIPVPTPTFTPTNTPTPTPTNTPIPNYVQMTGFEYGQASIYDLTNVEGNILTNNATIDTGHDCPRTGSYCLNADSVTRANESYLTILGLDADGLPIDFDVPILYFRVYANVITVGSARPHVFIQVNDFHGAGVPKLTLEVNPDRTVTLYNTTHTPVFTSSALSAAYHEFGILTTTGSIPTAYRLDIDNVTVSSGTMAQTAANVGGIVLGQTDTTNSEFTSIHFDDFLAATNTMPPPGGIELMPLNGAGYLQQWTGAYTDASQVPSDDMDTYLQRNGIGVGTQVTMYTVDPSVVSGTVHAIKGRSRMWKGDATATSTSLRLRANSTNSDTSLTDLIENVPTDYMKVLGLDPSDGNPWTVADMASVQVGALDTSGNILNEFNTTSGVQVDFAP